MISDFYLWRHLSLLLQPLTRQGIHLSGFLENFDAASGFEFFLALASGFPVDALSIPRLFDATGWFTDEELVETVEVRSMVIGFDFATILFFTFLLVHPFRHRVGAAVQAEIQSAAKRAEMADVEQIKKNVPFITWEMSFGQHVCELVFGVDLPD